jgi:alkanesulfonate monooxygenase SsuD/methylene tetrahydromethanopterin reductase-like flavin-dependent oxidoreductase (luciferase family)
LSRAVVVSAGVVIEFHSAIIDCGHDDGKEDHHLCAGRRVGYATTCRETWSQSSIGALAQWDCLGGGMTLAELSTLTSRRRLGTIVTSNTYRNPALLAKMVTTLAMMAG